MRISMLGIGMYSMRTEENRRGVRTLLLRDEKALALAVIGVAFES